jgi:hypothetical protein
MRKLSSIVATLAGCALLALWAAPAQAIPAFARAYKEPCTTCHVQFPKLNRFGMDFKQRGYRMPGQVGDYVWNGSDIPLSAMGTLTYEHTDAGPVETGDVDRRALDFFSAGSLGPKASFFLDYGFSTETYTDSNGDTVDVTGATPGATFLVLNDLLPDSLLNLRLGVMDNDFLYLSSPRRTTFADYLAPVTLDHTGVELNGVSGDVRYAAGFGDDEMVGVGGVKNNLRGEFGWATYTHWGQTVGARVFAAQAGASAAADHAHTQWEVNADLHRGPVNLILGYYAQDGVDGVPKDRQTNWLAEVVVPATHKVLLTGRYEVQNTESGGAAVAGSDNQAVANASYFLLPNISLSAEYSALNQKESHQKEDKVVFGFNIGI